jgi:hypothetical protein
MSSSGVGVLVCLEVPLGSEFGIDYEAFRTAEKFRGVKLIPTGLHFVFYSSHGEQSHGIRQGFFMDIRAGDVFMRKWSTETEELVPLRDERDAANLLSTYIYIMHAPFSFHAEALVGRCREDVSIRWEPRRISSKAP